MKALIVDDESPACAELRFMLRAHPDIQVVADASTLEVARTLVSRHKPEVVFLDINLLGEDGFDLVPDVPPATRIIFVTADDRHAIRAFRVNALDYLLKPVESKALADAVRRLFLPSAAAPAAEGGALQKHDRILLRNPEEQRFANVADILAVTAFGDYTRVHTVAGKPIMVHRTMKAWEDLLGGAGFIRVHRLTLLNLARVQRLVRDGDGGVAEMQGGALKLEVSRREMPLLREKLGKD